MALEYTLTRAFPSRWFALVTYILVFILVIILSVLNVALVGYETITSFQSNPNTTQRFWYDKMLPTRVPKPGSLCDARVFNVGDALTTNYSLFQWTVESISASNTGGGSGVMYKGRPLDNCDVTSLYVNGDLWAFSIDYTGIITCKGVDNYELTAKTSFSVSGLYGKHSPILGSVGTNIDTQDITYNSSFDARGFVISNLALYASNDLGARMSDIYNQSGGTSPEVLSFQVALPYCPASLGASAPCATEVPTYNIVAATALFSNHSAMQYSAAQPETAFNTPVISESALPAVNNIIQLMVASLRIDLGNPSPNNLLLNDSVVNTTLTGIFPETADAPALSSVAYNMRTDPVGTTQSSTSGLDTILPLTVSGSATVRVAYACRFQRIKTAGSLFVSVLVAVLSMTSGAWAGFMFLATAWVKRNPRANACETCMAEHGAPPYLRSGESAYSTAKEYTPVNH